MKRKKSEARSGVGKKFKKTLIGFIKDEDGFVSKQTILRVGLGTVSVMGVMGTLSNAVATHCNTTANHTNVPSVVRSQAVSGPGGAACTRFVAQHFSHNSHVNHSSY